MVHGTRDMPVWGDRYMRENDKPGVRRLGVEGMGRSYRPAAYLGFGRVYFNIAARDAPEPLTRLVLST